MSVTHPLAATFTRLNTYTPYYQIETGDVDGAGWFDAADLVSTESVMYDAVTRHNTEGKPADTWRRYTILNLFASSCWMMNMVGYGSLLQDRVLPDISLDNLRLHWNEGGWVDMAALRQSWFYTLPDGPAASHPDATVFPDVDALREQFRRQYEANVEALIPAVKTHARMGKTGLWATAADRCVSLLVYQSELVPDASSCEREALALLDIPDSPLRNRTGVVVIEHEGQRQPFMKRGACCWWYTVNDAREYCGTCPIRPMDERLELAKASMAEEAEVES